MSNHLIRHFVGHNGQVLIYFYPLEEKHMTTMMNVHEAKANFSGLLSDVENNLAIITIMRYGHPIARIVPIEHKRDMKPLPGFAGKVKMHGGDWFEDESDEWENA